MPVYKCRIIRTQQVFVWLEGDNEGVISKVGTDRLHEILDVTKPEWIYEDIAVIKEKSPRERAPYKLTA